MSRDVLVFADPVAGGLRMTTARRARPAVGLLLATSLAALSACATLPDYARPTVREVAPGGYAVADVIPYRELSREDFRAASPPGPIAAFAPRLGAYTCAQIVPGSFNDRLVIEGDADSGRYVARAPGLAFRAEMDRQCSWWNPSGTAASNEYVLQHEQIHFAIVELHARELQDRVAGLRGRGRSAAAAVNDLRRAIQRAQDETADRILAENTRFDEETSFSADRRRQSQWADTVFPKLR